MTEPRLAGPALLDSPQASPSPQPTRGDERRLTILGVEITDVTTGRAIEMIEAMLQESDGAARAIYFANAHTLNCAAADPDYRRLLNEAACVFGDGTGVRWAARLQGVRVRDNLCGTDLLPALMRTTAGRGYRYYLLGATEPVVRGAARRVAELLGDPSCVAGCHHGYLAEARLNDRVIDEINDCRADVLLVGMGNPIQERWIHEHRARLRVGVAMGVGGLFRYWSGDLQRSPRWLRHVGAEWLGILAQQPSKARRYLLGNPLFLWRIGREALQKGRSAGQAPPCPGGAEVHESTQGIGAPRWHLKKAARRTVALAACLPSWTRGKLRAATQPRLRVLTYHRCGERRFDPFCVTPRDFERQMRYLAEHELAVSLDALEACVKGGQVPRDGAVVVTIDDGFRSTLTHMLPVLRRYAIPAVAYVTPGLLASRACAGGQAAFRHDLPEPYLTWDELEQLAKGGIVIGSHGLTHRSLGRMDPVEARDEAARSREMLQQRLGRRVASFAYPYGTRADFNPTTANILAEVGYTTGFTSQHGAVRRGADPLTLPRIKVEGGESAWMFRCLCRGGLDAWGLFDCVLWRWQQSGR